MQVQFIDGIFYVIVLIMSIVIHEVAHGYSAYLLGDNTARLSGRLTLNPIKHLDLFGSILLPLFMLISNAGFFIGWAKPVPYNPANLRNGKRGDFVVAISGVVANLFIALVFGLLIRFGPLLGLPMYMEGAGAISPFYKISTMIVLMNLVLALFNMIPIPPLDGSKVLFSFLPARLIHIERFFERWGLALLIFFIVFLWKFVSPLIYIIFSFLTGVSLM